MVVPIVNPYAKKRRDSSTNIEQVINQNNVHSTINQQKSNCCSQQSSICCTTNDNNSNSNAALVVAAPVANTACNSVDDCENCCSSTVAPNLAIMGIQSQKRNGQHEKKENLNIKNIRRSNK